MRSDTAIAIITKNRPAELRRCLQSILHQTKQPNSVIVIDNDTSISARKIAKSKDFVSLKINYHRSRGSVPTCRNLALRLSKNKYLGFVDDDCVLDHNWLANGLELIKQKKLDYVLGKTELFNPQSLLAKAQHQRDAYWKKYNGLLFDTKNVLFDLAQIKKANLRFDESCQSSFYDSADFDFDFQVQKNKLKGANCPGMILHHQETTNLRRFLNRAYHRGKLAHYLDRKWQLQGKLSGGRDAMLLWWLARGGKNFARAKKQYHTTTLQTLAIRLFDRYYALGYNAYAKN